MAVSIVTDRMSAFAAGTRATLRNTLTLGAHVPLGMWQWTCMDGSTFASVAFEGTTLRGGNLLGWCGFSQELDLRPVIGVYVAPSHRGRGLAKKLVSALILELKGRDVIRDGEIVFATTSRWPQYVELLESHGLECTEWT